MPAIDNLSHPVILFDGVCNLCSSSVQFVIKRDKKDVFRFASLQSSFGQALLKNNNMPTIGFNSFILFDRKKIYTKSTGALMVAKKLGGVLSLLYFFIIIPSFIRDSIYDFIARNRYKWFGKKEECWIPTDELKNKFFD
jgi:predicted DCC family thiol-disulfide oxidoreductase YuxK